MNFERGFIRLYVSLSLCGWAWFGIFTIIDNFSARQIRELFVICFTLQIFSLVVVQLTKWVILGFKKDEVPETETAPSVDGNLVSKAQKIRKDITDKS